MPMIVNARRMADGLGCSIRTAERLLVEDPDPSSAWVTAVLRKFTADLHRIARQCRADLRAARIAREDERKALGLIRLDPRMVDDVVSLLPAPHPVRGSTTARLRWLSLGEMSRAEWAGFQDLVLTGSDAEAREYIWGKPDASDWRIHPRGLTRDDVQDHNAEVERWEIAWDRTLFSIRAEAIARMLEAQRRAEAELRLAMSVTSNAYREWCHRLTDLRFRAQRSVGWRPPSTPDSFAGIPSTTASGDRMRREKAREARWGPYPWSIWRRRGESPEPRKWRGDRWVTEPEPCPDRPRLDDGTGAQKRGGRWVSTQNPGFGAID
ncbi:protein of unknown function [Candidatus Hydrogenisulfobacillus filiaventi]|uniref:Uncharacterized protein n=1 Tax=Candidatus Hydrogenisulfobacillus filiaventi TaxID=2707344 RepID=A0A6F8ZIN0_9FIRM|nr:protein of unknown function [Candidatus Hydrogenisulfobacillus filiaventi]